MSINCKNKKKKKKEKEKMMDTPRSRSKAMGKSIGIASPLFLNIEYTHNVTTKT
jgi:hypothetical protein